MSSSPASNPQRKTRRQKVFAVIPTLLTLGNAVCGFGAITITAKVGPDNFSGNELFLASQLIFLAMLFDMLDGSAARLANQTSDFGAQLDSLCDAISFGVAPAFMMLKLTHPEHHLMASLDVPPPFEYSPRLLWAIAVLFMVCAILRLARFNVETDDDDSHDCFSGLPSPAAAGIIASFPIGLQGLKNIGSSPTGPLTDSTSTVVEGTSRQVSSRGVAWNESVLDYMLPALSILLPVIALATAILMVSRVRYPHVFNQLIRGHRSRIQLLQIVFTLLLVYVVAEMTVPVIFCYFAFSVPIRAVWNRYIRPRLFRTAEKTAVLLFVAALSGSSIGCSERKDVTPASTTEAATPAQNTPSALPPNSPSAPAPDAS
ncbi:MAG: phosphatidylcholine/phosphatidylserine synthase [Planctomyces sp.]|nr:phosphatidylcholine/phosphatidylserine synthase [Planctomyces sp.]